MFPAGVVGIALVILRLCVAGTLVSEISAKTFLYDPTPPQAFSLLLAILLCAGAFTPLVCGFILLVHLFALFHVQGHLAFEVVLYLLMTTSMLMLGPGAYSVDAKRFGRRVIFPQSR